MSHEQILIVEDDADVCLGYKVLLEAHGYRPVFAIDLTAALSQASKHQPDLIILDLGLPGPDGYAVLDSFDMYVFMVPVVVISARGITENKVRALGSGAMAYLQKPWNDADLLTLIRQLLDQPDLWPHQPSRHLPLGNVSPLTK